MRWDSLPRRNRPQGVGGGCGHVVCPLSNKNLVTLLHPASCHCASKLTILDLVLIPKIYLVTEGTQPDRLTAHSHCAPGNLSFLLRVLNSYLQEVTFPFPFPRSKPGIPYCPGLCSQLNTSVGYENAFFSATTSLSPGHSTNDCQPSQAPIHYCNHRLLLSSARRWNVLRHGQVEFPPGSGNRMLKATAKQISFTR